MFGRWRRTLFAGRTTTEHDQPQETKCTPHSLRGTHAQNKNGSATTVDGQVLDAPVYTDKRSDIEETSYMFYCILICTYLYLHVSFSVFYGYVVKEMKIFLLITQNTSHHTHATGCTRTPHNPHARKHTRHAQIAVNCYCCDATISCIGYLSRVLGR